VPENTSAERQYAEELAVALSSLGMPPATGKLMGWLLICDPPTQSSGQLAQALNLSKGSISTSMRMLERGGLVRRVAASGGRGHCYEMRPDALMAASTEVSRYRLMREAMEQGLKLLGDESTPRAERLRTSRDFYAFMEQETPRLVERFTETRKESDG
jgi:DNA-binding transcriptional regulator GbsR (MarR family)